MQASGCFDVPLKSNTDWNCSITRISQAEHFVVLNVCHFFSFSPIFEDYNTFLSILLLLNFLKTKYFFLWKTSFCQFYKHGFLRSEENVILCKICNYVVPFTRVSKNIAGHTNTHTPGFCILQSITFLSDLRKPCL